MEAGKDVSRPVIREATLDGGVDEAYTYLKNHVDADVAGSHDLNIARRKADWYIVPIMFVIYCFGFLDKVSLNYAAVMGITPNLKLRGNEFSNTATYFFVAYLIFELPTIYVLNKAPAGKFLAVATFLWGIACACSAAAKDYQTLLVARVFMGIFEAPMAPCMMLISSQWYTKPEQGPRFAFWYCGLGVGQLVGGAVSYGFQHVTNQHLEGWRIMWIMLGLLTVVVGFMAFFVLPDSPVTARFLTEAQKTAILKHVSVNQTGVVNHKFKPRQLLDGFVDFQLWALALMTVLPAIGSGVIATYSATLIRNFGYTPKHAALLNMPSGAITIFATLVVGYAIQYTSNRWLWYIACCIPGIIGGGLMGFLGSGKHGLHKQGLLAGIYLVNFITPTVIITYNLASANTAGHTKRAYATTLMSAAFGLGNIIGPQTFQARDAPGYYPAKIALMATTAAGAVLAAVLFGYYVFNNRNRGIAESVGAEKDALDEEKWSNLTDKENKSFRYVY